MKAHSIKYLRERNRFTGPISLPLLQSTAAWTLPHSMIAQLSQTVTGFSNGFSGGPWSMMAGDLFSTVPEASCISCGAFFPLMRGKTAIHTVVQEGEEDQRGGFEKAIAGQEGSGE